MNPLARLYWTARAVGWDNLPRRVVQAVRARTGWLRHRLDPRQFCDAAFAAATSATVADQRRLWAEKAKRFFPAPSPADLERVAERHRWAERVLTVAEKAFAGDYPFFGNWMARLGWPPDFNLDPIHGIRYPIGEHCTKTARSGPPGDDLKLVWEPSRFSLAFILARAYARSADERFAEAFWAMFDAWIEQNPPMLAVAWGCGQESTFRLMAMLFAAVNTLNSQSATEQRLWAVSRYAWQVARLIEVNLNYARSQKNNHAISEAAALWTIGLMFPEFGQAGRWRQLGRRVLAAEIRRQVYCDGSYVQHSMNYHRVMIDDLLWAVRLGELHGQRLDEIVYDRLRRATGWLVQMIEPLTGRVPNYGPNDGAQVLPLSTCDYLDYRPAAQAANVLLTGRRAFEPGPWDEKMLWLCGGESLAAETAPAERPATWSAPAGGYYIVRGRDSQAMIRCHSYRDRPSQADMLHMDLWWRGVNVLRDGGSYHYYHANPDWQRWFSSTAAHNTVELAGQSQMIKGPRFMWFRWTKAKTLAFRGDERSACFVGQHLGYARLPLPGRPAHTREVILADAEADQTWTICDKLAGDGEQELAIRWRLCDADWQQDGATFSAVVAGGTARLELSLPDGVNVELVCGQDRPIEGWESLYYGQKQPAVTVVARGLVRLPATATTRITLKPAGDCSPQLHPY